MPVPYMSIHSCRVLVEDEDAYIVSFPAVFNQYFFGKTPIITAMTEGATLANVNCFVDQIDLQSQTAVLRFSAKFTGHVHLTAIVR